MTPFMTSLLLHTEKNDSIYDFITTPCRKNDFIYDFNIRITTSVMTSKW